MNFFFQPKKLIIISLAPLKKNPSSALYVVPQ